MRVFKITALVLTAVLFVAVHPLNALAGSSVRTSAAPTEKCGGFKNMTWKACVYTPAGSANADDILYYLHPAGANEKNWNQMGPAFNRAWGDGKLPTVVAVSWGPQWLMTQPNGSPNSGLLQLFVQEVMPAIERNVIGRSPRQRFLMGASMGGFNATELALQYPQLFAKAALLCPGYIDFNPYDTDTRIADYIARTGANRDYVQQLLEMIRMFYPNAAAWAAEAPLATATTRVNPQTPSLYIAVAKDDPFGFSSGARQFAQLVQSRGARVQFSDRMSGHCGQMDVPAIAAFLEP